MKTPTNGFVRYYSQLQIYCSQFVSGEETRTWETGSNFLRISILVLYACLCSCEWPTVALPRSEANIKLRFYHLLSAVRFVTFIEYVE